MSAATVEGTDQSATIRYDQIQQEKAKSKGPKNKELRNLEQQLFKSQPNLSPEAKLEVVLKKCAELLEENKASQASLKNYERHIQVSQKEKEQLQTENGKLLLARSRLEEVARELQRQNKAVKEETTLRVREEEEKRKEVSTKFQSTLTEVSALLRQNNEKNAKLREENAEMAGKLQILCDQYAVREEHLGKLGKQYDIERQLNEAKLAKVRMESAEMKEKMLQDKQKLLLELTEYQRKCQMMQQEEVSLRQQLSMYTDKYDEFQKALAASNKTFSGFKSQMDTMTKKLKSLEKETASWKQRWEKSNNCLLEMAAEKKKTDDNLLNATKQLSQLESLCRALQTERTSLLQKIKEQDAASTLHVVTLPMKPDQDIQGGDLPASSSEVLAVHGNEGEG